MAAGHDDVVRIAAGGLGEHVVGLERREPVSVFDVHRHRTAGHLREQRLPERLREADRRDRRQTAGLAERAGEHARDVVVDEHRARAGRDRVVGLDAERAGTGKPAGVPRCTSAMLPAVKPVQSVARSRGCRRGRLQRRRRLTGARVGHRAEVVAVDVRRGRRRDLVELGRRVLEERVVGERVDRSARSRRRAASMTYCADRSWPGRPAKRLPPDIVAIACHAAWWRGPRRGSPPRAASRSCCCSEPPRRSPLRRAARPPRSRPRRAGRSSSSRSWILRGP